MLASGKIQPDSDSERRYVRIAQGVATGLASRGVSVVVSFFSVPLTIGYLGTERYAIWVLLSAVLAWINLAEFGLGDGLLNAVSTARARNEPCLARVFVATTFWIFIAISVILGLGLWLLWPSVDWPGLFSVRSGAVARELSPALTATLAVFLISLPLSVFNKVLFALQEARLANLWATAANLVSFLGLIVVTLSKSSLVWLVLGYSGSLLAVNVIGTLWLFFRHAPWLRPDLLQVRAEVIGKLSATGGTFFLISLSSLLLLQTDNFIIAHYLAPRAVVQYSITWRLFQYTTLLQALAVTTLWPAYAEAFTRNDTAWIVRTFRGNLIYSVGITALLVGILTIFGQSIIRAWAGSDAVPPFVLLLWMGGWSLISCSMTAIGCLLNGSGNSRGQSIYGNITAVANLGLSIVLIQHFGIPGVIAATVIAYAIFNIGPALFETKLVLERLSKCTR